MVEYKHKELTREIINAAYAVHNTLGHGFLEKVYHRSLFIELCKRGYSVEFETHIEVRYDDQVVGDFSADLLIEGRIIVEVKAVDKYTGAFEAQLLNYLKATGLEVGLIINFGPSVEVKRMVL
ncbi:MAG TPA: GxxExxY protein [Sedimentisphaerales bacterium]|nr:GxxExxY protein [Sedimentisphaerales bacterium]